MGRSLSGRFSSIALAVAAPALAFVFVPAIASGDPKKPAAAEKSDHYDPDNVTAISQFMEAIAKGTELYMAKNPTGGIDAYKKAIQLSPKNPLGHYMLAEAFLGQANFGEADAEIAQAMELSDAKNPSLRSRILFLNALIRERERKLSEAKAAWQQYAEHAAKFADAGAFPQTAADRIKAIQKVLDNEKAMVVVKERIAADKAANASKDAGAPKKK